MKKTGFRRACALALALVLAMSVLSIAAFAEDPAPSTEAPAATPLETLQKTLTDAQAALAEAQTALTAAQSAYDAAATALTEKTEWDTAEAAAMTAQEALAEAQASQDAAAGETEKAAADAAVAAAQTALATANASATAAHNAYTQVAATLKEGTALKTAQDTFAAAQTAADAAQAALDGVTGVTQMIANLPSPIQYDDADDIAAARKAYDALSEAQKAAVENYDKLTAAEAAWNQCDRWGQVSAREFAPTSDGISYAITYQSYSTQKVYTQAEIDAMLKGLTDQAARDLTDRLGLFPARITYTIPASYTGDTVNIFAADAVNDAMNIIKYLPGDAKAMQIEVINLSAHSYTYAEGSFSVSTEVYQTYYDLKMADSSGIPAFDKQTIPVQYLAHRTSNSAIEALLRKSTAAIFSTEVTDEALGEKLLALKDSSGNSLYPNGIQDLNKYYLDFYNKKYNTNHTKLEQFSNTQIAYGIFSGNATNVPETNPELATLAYNFFYNHLYSVTPAGLDPTGSDAYTVAQCMRDHAAGGTVFDKGLTAAFGTIAAFTDNGNAQDDSYVWDGCENWMDARDTTNFYQGYNFGYTMGFQLARTDSDVTVSKTDAASGAALSGATFNLYRMVNDAKEYLTDTAGALTWTADQTAATVFTAGSFTVKSLPFGTYYLSELTAPSGYDKRTSDAEIVVDKTAETFAITNSQTPSGGGDDDDDDTPVPPVKPEEPTVIPETPTPEAPAPVTPATEIPEPAAPLAEVPKTGDASALWLALAGISGISLAAVSLRKKRDGE